jgi:CheY-like chemotaxis protein
MRTMLILLVEDDENDVFLMKAAFEQAGLVNPVHVASDGQEAIEYLGGVGEYADRRKFPVPYLVLLDLKLPHASGAEVLSWLRARAEFDSTVVIVLTSSGSPEDVARAYHLRANAFVIKPSGLSQLRALAQAIKDFWFTYNYPGLWSLPDSPA